jgi:hypothetical protein
LREGKIVPLQFAPESKSSTDVVRAGLARMLQRKNELGLASDALGALEVVTPHSVYDLRADEIANGGGLETAHASGTRYLVTDAGGPLAAAEVQSDTSGQPLLANLNYGPYVVATATAFASLNTSAAVGQGSYEARLLRFSAIYLVAIWLKAQGSGNDLIYVVAPVPDGLQAEKPYSVDEFLAAIRPLAKKRASNKKESIP